MHNDNTNPISFATVDKLVVDLDEKIAQIQEYYNTTNQIQQYMYAVYARQLLYIAWNFARGLDIVAYCKDDGSSTPLNSREC